MLVRIEEWRTQQHRRAMTRSRIFFTWVACLETWGALNGRWDLPAAGMGSGISFLSKVKEKYERCARGPIRVSCYSCVPQRWSLMPRIVGCALAQERERAQHEALTCSDRGSDARQAPEVDRTSCAEEKTEPDAKARHLAPPGDHLSGSRRTDAGPFLHDWRRDRWANSCDFRVHRGHEARSRSYAFAAAVFPPLERPGDRLLIVQLCRGRYERAVKTLTFPPTVMIRDRARIWPRREQRHRRTVCWYRPERCAARRVG